MASGESVVTPPPKRKCLATGESPEVQALQMYSGALVDAILNPKEFAWQLYLNGIITSVARDRALLPQQIKYKNSVLLSAVEGKIKTEPQFFHTFVELLRVHDDLHLRVLGQRIAAAHAPLNITDHYQPVRKALLKVRTQWHNIGLELGIPVWKVKEFSGSHEKKIDQMVEVWLNHTYSTPTWGSLTVALRDDTVEGGKPVADEIETKYIHGGKSVSQAEATQSQSVGPNRASQPTKHPSSPRPQPTEHAASSPQASPRPDTPLTQYADYLRTVYTTSELPVYYKWPPTQSTKFINLAVISKERTTKQEADEFTKATLHGDVDQILRIKKPVKMEHVLTPDQGENLKCVLVEGGPGVGKSTFSWELCKQWGKGQLFQEYSAVILLRLRDKSVQRATRLSDLIYYTDEEVQKQIVSEVVKSKGKGMLIVLDGVDELPRNLLNESSVFGRLLSGVDLPLATVLVTSRPSATEQLFSKWTSQISKHIEVIGFREKDIEDYARSVLPPDDLPGFKEYLSIHPHIKTMMYIPLNSVIVTEVYKYCKWSDNTTPTTVTQLYTNLSHTLLLRYLDSHPEYKDLQCELSDFSDLPPRVLTQFRRLCEVAYEGVCSQKIVFSDLGRSFDHLGFMHSTTDIYAPTRASVSYSYLHFSIQEYLAAIHISLMSPDEQTKLFRGYRKEEYLRNTWRYVAGITQLKSIDLSVLREVIIEESPIGRLLYEAYQLTPDTVELLYETQNMTILSDPSSTVRFDGELSLTPSVCVALAYCIAHSRCVWDLSVVDVWGDDEAQILGRGLKDCDPSRAGCIHTVRSSNISAQVLTDMPHHVLQGITVLNSMLVRSTAECMCVAKIIPVMSSLHTLGFKGEDVSEEAQTELCQGLSQLSSLRVLDSLFRSASASGSALKQLLLSTQTLEELTLEGASPETITLIAEALCTNCSLRTLYLSPAPFSRSSWFNLESTRAFTAMLTVNRTLTSVNISCCNIDSDCVQCLSEALVHNNALERLNMSRNNIGVAGAKAFAAMLRVNRTLTSVDIFDCHIDSDCAQCLSEALVHNNTLENLDMSMNNIGVAGARAFAAMLRVNRTLTSVDIFDCHIDSDCAQCLSEALVHNNTLANLNMSDNNIGVAGAKAFAAMLRVNQTLTSVNTSGSHIDSECVQCLSEALVHNDALENLNMSKNNIGVAGAKAFAAMLRVNRTLTSVDISFCGIDSDCAQCLSEALVHNDTLANLDMSYNNIGVAGAHAVAKMLEKISALKILGLCETNIGIEGAELLVNSLKSNHHLEHIMLSFDHSELKQFGGYHGNEERLLCTPPFSIPMKPLSSN